MVRLHIFGIGCDVSDCALTRVLAKIIVDSLCTIMSGRVYSMSIRYHAVIVSATALLNSVDRRSSNLTPSPVHFP